MRWSQILPVASRSFWASPCRPPNSLGLCRVCPLGLPVLGFSHSWGHTRVPPWCPFLGPHVPEVPLSCGMISTSGRGQSHLSSGHPTFVPPRTNWRWLSPAFGRCEHSGTRFRLNAGSAEDGPRGGPVPGSAVYPSGTAVSAPCAHARDPRTAGRRAAGSDVTRCWCSRSGGLAETGWLAQGPLEGQSGTGVGEKVRAITGTGAHCQLIPWAPWGHTHPFALTQIVGVGGPSRCGGGDVRGPP